MYYTKVCDTLYLVIESYYTVLTFVFTEIKITVRKKWIYPQVV